MIARPSRQRGFAQVELVAYLPCLVLILLLVIGVVRLGVEFLTRSAGESATPRESALAGPQGEPFGRGPLQVIDAPNVSLPDGDRQAMRAIAQLAD